MQRHVAVGRKTVPKWHFGRWNQKTCTTPVVICLSRTHVRGLQLVACSKIGEVLCVGSSPNDLSVTSGEGASLIFGEPPPEEVQVAFTLRTPPKNKDTFGTWPPLEKMSLRHFIAAWPTFSADFERLKRSRLALPRPVHKAPQKHRQGQEGRDAA